MIVFDHEFVLYMVWFRGVIFLMLYEQSFMSCMKIVEFFVLCVGFGSISNFDG